MTEEVNLQQQDEYTRYEKGLNELFNRLGESHPTLAEARKFQQRLLKNIANSRRYGESELSRSELLKTVEQINRIALNELGISFYELSGCPTVSTKTGQWALFSDAECRLREQIADPALRSSINSIRHTVEYIWNEEKPRIIQDGTDHGPEYCKRLMEFADRLLAANDGRSLSPQELYLLLAGIYLHDIGMQCDVVEMPEVRERAEKMGARFNVDFGQNKPEAYTIRQQKAIRKNHAYLSAAWIAYARQTGDTALGPAAMSIPRELLDDLVDVCCYHTGLPLNDCPITLKFDPAGRKQLIVALLRFADELDIEINRVPIEIIKTHVIDQRNIVYWWLHNRARVLFIARNVIRLAIFLHPDDAAAYGDFVYNAFINEFQSRNAPALNVLAKNGFPIVIDAESQIETYEREEFLPPDVVQAFQTALQREPLYELAEEVRTWLRAMRYEVTAPQQREEHIFEMIATLDLGAVRQRICVRCVGGTLKVQDVDGLDKVLGRKMPQGWLICEKRVPDAVHARIEAQKDDAIEVFTLAEFLQQKVWGPYFDALTALVEKDRITSYYVDLKGYLPGWNEAKAEGSDEIAHMPLSSLDDYVDIWLAGRGRRHLTILGDYGAGKSWFCRHYADRQLKRYLKDPAHERLPLLITLRDFTRAMNVQQLLNEALLEHYKLPFVGSGYPVFDEINRRGKLLLILDGFDEMARQADTSEAIAENFRELTQLVEDNSKVILTSQPGYFSCGNTGRECSEEPLPPSMVSRLPGFEVLFLEPFDDAQIRRVITLRLGAKQGPALAEHILQTPNLSLIARKAVRIDLLLNALQEVNEEALQKLAHVYLYATNALLLRNIDTRRTFTATTDKIYFLCELAWEMIRSGEARIHYSQIPQRIKTFFGPRLKDQHELDTWDYDLRQQRLLLRNAAGYYEFSHKVIAEYFVAYKFAAELGCLASLFPDTYCDTAGCESGIPQREFAELAETFGAISLGNQRMQGIRTLLPGMLTDDAPERLRALIAATRGKTPHQVRYIGGNAITLLNTLGESFVGANLENTVLIGADFRGANLSEANLCQASLCETMLEDATLDNADLRGADLALCPALLAGTTCRGAQIGGARGLDQQFSDSEGETLSILLELFAERGAVLDNEQQQMIAEKQAARPAGKRKTGTA